MSIFRATGAFFADKLLTVVLFTSEVKVCQKIDLAFLAKTASEDQLMFLPPPLAGEIHLDLVFAASTPFHGMIQSTLAVLKVLLVVPQWLGIANDRLHRSLLFLLFVFRRVLICVEIGDGGAFLVHIKLNVLVLATIALIVDVEWAKLACVELTVVENDEVVV